MSCSQCALDTLIQRVTSVEEQLSSIQQELEGCMIFYNSLMLENAVNNLKDQRVSIQFALSQARRASTTEPPGSGKDN